MPPTPTADEGTEGSEIKNITAKLNVMIKERNALAQTAADRKNLIDEQNVAGQQLEQQVRQGAEMMNEMQRKLDLAGLQATHLADHARLAGRRVDELDGRNELAAAQSRHLARRQLRRPSVQTRPRRWHKMVRRW